MHAIAKINLFLKIVNKRSDGYHNLESIFLPIPELYDDVSLSPSEAPGINLELGDGCTGVPSDHSNICLKAADAFVAATNLHPNVTIHLSKQIPVAAGMGGGSSDAAAVLNLLNEYCKNPLSLKQLHTIATKLGADVPFFLEPKCSLGTGIGERLAPLPLRLPLNILIAAPLFPVPVAWAFNNRKQPPADAPSLEQFLKAIETRNARNIAQTCRNDLEYALFDKFPCLDMMRQAMLQAGADTVHVSGSGPTLFALSTDNENLSAINQACQDAFPAQTIITHAQ